MKKVVVGFVVLLAAISANASFLYWQLDNEATDSVNVIGTYIKDSSLTYENAAARVVIKDSDGVLVKQGDTVALSGEWYTGPYQAVSLEGLKADDLKGYSYYIEVVNSTDASIKYGYSEKQTYTDVKGAIADDISMVPFASVWHGGNGYKATPEPTSAMLMLLGVAGLALRRKQRKIA